MNKKPKARFDKDDVVYLDFGRGEVEGPFTVKSRSLNPLTRIFMYSFKEKGNMSCGEMYLKSEPDGEKLSLDDVLHEPTEGQLNILEGISSNGESIMEGMRFPSNALGTLFFRPYKEMIKWLVEYANGRLIIDVGCGTGFLLRQLHENGAKCMGIEPMWSGKDLVQWNIDNITSGKGMIHVLPNTVQDSKTFIGRLGNKALMLFARPCHSNFIEEGLDLRPEGMEALYITIPENLKRYDDLGKWRQKAILLQHTGSSADKEVVYSIK